MPVAADVGHHRFQMSLIILAIIRDHPRAAGRPVLPMSGRR
jgi:hypothetical protein